MRPTLTLKKLHFYSAAAVLAMSVVSIGIFWWRNVTLAELFASDYGLLSQIISGVLIGAGVALAISLFEFKTQIFNELDAIGRMIFEDAKPRWWDLALISCGAGFGEELLFRGAIQPWIGIWPAAVLFMLAHGAWNLRKIEFILYSAILLFAGVGLGYLSHFVGLVSAMVAHAVYDMTVLSLFGWKLSREKKSPD